MGSCRTVGLSNAYPPLKSSLKLIILADVLFQEFQSVTSLLPWIDIINSGGHLHTEEPIYLFVQNGANCQAFAMLFVLS